MSDRLPIPEIDDRELREHILKLRGLVAEETIETLRMVRLDHIVNPQGKILPRRRTGLSAKNQRLMARAIKRARHLALLPIAGARPSWM